MEWNYKEVISALITSPQPLMLFRSIRPIKVQTSSADKAAEPQQKYCLLASGKEEVFLQNTRAVKNKKDSVSLENLNSMKLAFVSWSNSHLQITSTDKSI